MTRLLLTIVLVAALVGVACGRKQQPATVANDEPTVREPGADEGELGDEDEETEEAERAERGDEADEAEDDEENREDDEEPGDHPEPDFDDEEP